MSLVINNNSTAGLIANKLTAHYGNLSQSTERLSSGLRINSAADDAAGLAIRELMRSDVAALNQGVRNANDAISMLQTVDGALAIIDEKLIRMKELAEQAATGTYDSVQRLMIDSEFQQMASEIERIAQATDFNGVKLLDGNYSSSSTSGTSGTSGTATSSTDPTVTYDYNLSSPTVTTGTNGTIAFAAYSLTNPINNPENYIGSGDSGTTTIDVKNNNLIQISGTEVSASVFIRGSATTPTLTVAFDPNAQYYKNQTIHSHHICKH